MGGQTHNVTNFCLDGKKEVTISPNTVFMSEKIHILSMEGHTLVQDSAVLQANELEIFSSGKAHINQGARLNIKNKARIVSTYQGDSYTPIRFGSGSLLEVGNLDITGYGKVNFGSMSATASGALSVRSIGTSATNNISVFQGIHLKGSECFHQLWK